MLGRVTTLLRPRSRRGVSNSTVARQIASKYQHTAFLGSYDCTVDKHTHGGLGNFPTGQPRGGYRPVMLRQTHNANKAKDPLVRMGQPRVSLIPIGALAAAKGAFFDNFLQLQLRCALLQRRQADRGLLLGPNRHAVQVQVLLTTHRPPCNTTPRLFTTAARTTTAGDGTPCAPIDLLIRSSCIDLRRSRSCKYCVVCIICVHQIAIREHDCDRRECRVVTAWLDFSPCPRSQTWLAAQNAAATLSGTDPWATCPGQSRRRSCPCALPSQWC